MGLRNRLDLAVLLLGVLVICSLVHVFTGVVPFRAWALFDSGFVGYLIDRGSGPPVQYTAAILLPCVFLVLMYFIVRRSLWAMWGALALVVLDGTILFTAGGLGSALSASLAVPFHCILCVSLIGAALAERQWRFNEQTSRRLEVEAELKRKLGDSDAPPPPAATFTRYGQAPPA
jgi:hypothetical protein